MPATVFVTQIPHRRSGEDRQGPWVSTIDVSSAAKFGTIKIIMPHTENSPLDTSTLVNEFLKAFSDFDWRRDFIILTGDPTILAIATFVLAEFTNKFTMLRWDKRMGYIPVEVAINE